MQFLRIGVESINPDGTTNRLSRMLGCGHSLRGLANEEDGHNKIHRPWSVHQCHSCSQFWFMSPAMIVTFLASSSRKFPCSLRVYFSRKIIHTIDPGDKVAQKVATKVIICKPS
eukprot:gene7794-15944_t